MIKTINYLKVYLAIGVFYVAPITVFAEEVFSNAFNPKLSSSYSINQSFQICKEEYEGTLKAPVGGEARRNYDKVKVYMCSCLVEAMQALPIPIFKTKSDFCLKQGQIDAKKVETPITNSFTPEDKPGIFTVLLYQDCLTKKPFKKISNVKGCSCLVDHIRASNRNDLELTGEYITKFSSKCERLSK